MHRRIVVAHRGISPFKISSSFTHPSWLAGWLLSAGDESDESDERARITTVPVPGTDDLYFLFYFIYFLYLYGTV